MARKQTSAPSITDMEEMIRDLVFTLGRSLTYLEHPEVIALPLCGNPIAVAERARKDIAKANDLLDRACGGIGD